MAVEPGNVSKVRLVRSGWAWHRWRLLAKIGCSNRTVVATRAWKRSNKVMIAAKGFLTKRLFFPFGCKCCLRATLRAHDAGGAWPAFGSQRMVSDSPGWA